MVREFNFKSTVEEFKIEGDIYKVDFSDKKLREYQEKFNEFLEESAELEKLRHDNMTSEEQENYFNSSYKLCEKMIDTVLGEGSFDKLYEKSGKSIFNMIDVIEFLSEAVGEKTVRLREENKSKYVKPKKPRKK